LKHLWQAPKRLPDTLATFQILIEEEEKNTKVKPPVTIILFLL